jgi:hypothetical protein
MVLVGPHDTEHNNFAHHQVSWQLLLTQSFQILMDKDKKHALVRPLQNKLDKIYIVGYPYTEIHLTVSHN